MDRDVDVDVDVDSDGHTDDMSSYRLSEVIRLGMLIARKQVRNPDSLAHSLSSSNTV